MAEPQLLYKDNSLPLETPDEKGWVEGYASVYDVVDSQKDAVDRGAFAKALSNPGKIKFLWQHDYKRPVGRIHKLWDDEKGLKYRARYNLKTSWGRDAYEAAVNQDIDGNSIGYDLRNGKAFKDDDGVQHLSDINLWEVSNVTFPSNVEATNTSVKSDSMFTKSITDQDKTDLLAGIDKENLQDLTSYHRRLHQWSAQGALLTGFSQSDMDWLHTQVEKAMCAIHKAAKPPEDCADPSPLEWKKSDGTEIEFKCAHISAVTDRIKERESAKDSGGKGDEPPEEKQGRVLSAKNESDLRDAHGSLKDAHTKIAGVLKQVTGKAPSEDVPGDTVAPPVAPDNGNGKSAENEAIKLKLTEILNLVKSKS